MKIEPSTGQTDSDYPDGASSDRPISNETHVPDGASGGQSTSNETSLPDGGSGGSIDNVTQAGRTEDGIDPVLPHLSLQSTSTCVERYGSPSALSVLTALPSEPSSPLFEPNLSLAPEPSSPVRSPTFPPFPPGDASSSTNPSESIPQASINGKHKQRVLMDFVDVPRPDWYKRIRGKEKATPRAPLRCSETPEVVLIPHSVDIN